MLYIRQIMLEFQGVQALYKREVLAIAIDESLKTRRPDDWRDHLVKRRMVAGLIREHIEAEDLAKKIYSIVEEQKGY